MYISRKCHCWFKLYTIRLEEERVVDTRSRRKNPSENCQITAFTSSAREEMTPRSNCGKIGNSMVEQKCSMMLDKLPELLASLHSS